MSDADLEALGRVLLDHAADLLDTWHGDSPAPRPGSSAGAPERSRRSLLEGARDRFHR